MTNRICLIIHSKFVVVIYVTVEEKIQAAGSTLLANDIWTNVKPLCVN